MAENGASDGEMTVKLEPPSPVNGTERNGHSLHESEDYDSEDSTETPLDFSMKSPKVNGSLEPTVNGHSRLSNHHVSSGRREPDRYGYRSADNDADSRSSNSSGDQIGEPRTANPAAMSGASLSHLAMIQGLKPSGMMPSSGFVGTAMPNMSAFYDPRNISHHAESLKGARPHKGFPKDHMSLPIGYYGVPGFQPLPNVDQSAIANINKTTEELYEMYKQQLLKIHDLESKKRHRGSGFIRGDTQSPPTDTPATPSPSLSSPPPLVADTSLGPMPASSPPVSGSTTPSSRGRKRARSLPDEQKDQAYWERRRKNNEAAKRSRDTRRAKEDEIAIRAALLEQENLKLRVEVAALKTETAKLKVMLQNGN